jgi:hypothetical protein
VAFIDKRDSLRRDVGNPAVNRALTKPRERFRIPIPAIGEAFHIINTKATENLDRKKDAFRELEYNVRNNVFEITGLGKNSDAFIYARELVEYCSDNYEQITPMDALIVAVAITDVDCSKVYTKDNMLLMNTKIHEHVDEKRESLDFPKIKFSVFV